MRLNIPREGGSIVYTKTDLMIGKLLGIGMQVAGAVLGLAAIARMIQLLFA